MNSKYKFECSICCNDFYCNFKIQSCNHELCFYCLMRVKKCPFCRKRINTAKIYYDNNVDFLKIYDEILTIENNKRKKPSFRIYVNKTKNFHLFKSYLANHPYPLNLDKIIMLISQHNILERDILMHTYFSSVDNAKPLFYHKNYLLDETHYRQIKLLNIRKHTHYLIKYSNPKNLSINYFTCKIVININQIVNVIQYNIFMNNGIFLTSMCNYELILEIIKCQLNIVLKITFLMSINFMKTIFFAKMKSWMC